MSYIDRVKTPEGTIYDLQGIEYIVGTQAAATNAWTGVTHSSKLYAGKMIAYKLPFAGNSSAATLNLTLSGGSTTGAKTIYRNTSTVTTHYPAASVIVMTYDGTYWRICDYDSTNIYQLRNNNGTYIAGAALYRYQILLTKNETTLIPVSNGNNTTATGKTITTTEFDPFGDIYYYNSTVSVAANAAIGASTPYRQMSVNLAYSFNTTNTLTNNKDVYLVASPTTAGKAKLHSTPTTQALPTSKNGLIYIYLGHAYSTSNIELRPTHPVYYHDGTGIRKWTGKELTDTTYSAISTAELTAGTATTSRVITAANLMTFVKQSVLPVGSVLYSTVDYSISGNQICDIGTWEKCYDIQSFEYNNTGIYPYERNYSGYYTTDEGFIFMVNIPFLSTAMRMLNYQHSTSSGPFLSCDFGSSGTVASIFRAYTVNASANGQLNSTLSAPSGGGDMYFQLRSIQGDNAIVQTGPISSTSYLKNYGSDVGIKWSGLPANSKQPIIFMRNNYYPIKLNDMSDAANLEFYIYRRVS